MGWFHFLTSLELKVNYAREGWFHFLTSLKPEVNFAQGLISFFNELGIRVNSARYGVVLFFNELETKSKLCSINVLILEHNENQKGF